MKTQKIKFAAIFSATLFLTAIFFALAAANASAQKLKPGEIIYSRRASVNIPNCVDSSIWAMGPGGENDRLLFTNGLHPRISPDGRFLLFKRFNLGFGCGPNSGGAAASPDLVMRELATGRETIIAPARFPILGHFFSPETNRGSNQIIYDENRTICRMNTNGTNRFCTTPPLNFSFWAHPSVRGGDNLVVISNNNTSSIPGLYTYDYDLTNPQKIPNTMIGDLSAVWSNDGLTIAYGTSGNNHQDVFDYPYFLKNLYKIQPDGSNKTQLTFLNPPVNEGFAFGMIWTLDNSTILAAGRINGVSGIYKISASGGIIGRIPITPGRDPDWIGGIVPVFGEKQVAAWGGGVTSGGSFTLVDTIGQAFAGQTSVGENFNLQSGFWTIDEATSRTPFDFDGDGKSDVSVFRPGNGVWYLQQSTAGFTGVAFGLGTDKLAPADYDGDGKTDIAVYRDGTWYLLRSRDGFTGIAFGVSTDIPVPADFDGDGKAEVAVYRPSNGTWYIYNLATNQTYGVTFGISEDKPLPTDYDGDGKADIAVFRPSTGVWYLQQSTAGFAGFLFGISIDIPVPADYDGDGKADIAVFRPSSGIWYLQQSTAGFTGTAFGLGTDLPVPADYDGDGKADISVFRNGTWYLLRSTAGFTGLVFGTSTDLPIPNSFIH